MEKIDSRENGIGFEVKTIGSGALGGKAQGLVDIYDYLVSEVPSEKFPEIQIEIPSMTVVMTDIFDSFMENNDLYSTALGDLPDTQIALVFQQAELPFQALGQIRELVSSNRSPLAVRSSSLLEDTIYKPFAGVYATKMIPNNQLDQNQRFRKLSEAIKYVYASTFFKSAKSYIQATRHEITEEKMAVIIQDEVGN